MKLKQLFKNLDLFFSYFPITKENKNHLISIIYDVLNVREKNIYKLNIDEILDKHELKISLIDFFQVQVDIRKSLNDTNKSLE